MQRHTHLIRRAFSWPLPSVAGSILAVVVSAAGQPEQAATFGLTGCAASIVLAWGALRRAQAEISDLQEHLEHAMNHGGFRDAETGLGTLAALRLDWARQVARLQRRGERFSLAVYDLREEGGAPDAAFMRAAGALLRSSARTEDTLYRLSLERIGVLLPGSDVQGAAAFIERVRTAMDALALGDGEKGAGVTIETDVVSWREGVDTFPEARILFMGEDEYADANRMFHRLSHQRAGQPEQLRDAA